MKRNAFVALLLALAFSASCGGYSTPTSSTPCTTADCPGLPPPAGGPLPGTDPLPIPIPGTNDTLEFRIVKLTPEIGGAYVNQQTRGWIEWACTGPMITSYYMKANFSDGPGTPEYGSMTSSGLSISNGLCTGYSRSANGPISTGRSPSIIRYLRLRVWLNKLAAEGSPDAIVDVAVNWIPAPS